MLCVFVRARACACYTNTFSNCSCSQLTGIDSIGPTDTVARRKENGTVWLATIDFIDRCHHRLGETLLDAREKGVFLCIVGNEGKAPLCCSSLQYCVVGWCAAAVRDSCSKSNNDKKHLWKPAFWKAWDYRPPMLVAVRWIELGTFVLRFIVSGWALRWTGGTWSERMSMLVC